MAEPLGSGQELVKALRSEEWGGSETRGKADLEFEDRTAAGVGRTGMEGGYGAPQG